MSTVPIYRRPSRKELGGLLRSVEPQALSILLLALRAPAGDENAPLPTGTVLQIATYDWMTATNVLSNARKLLFLLATADRFENAGRAFQHDEPSGKFTPRVLIFNDYQYATFGPLHADRMSQSLLPFFDVREERWISVMPQQALTIVACDLNVLLLRLFAMMERYRKERKDAADAAKRDSQPAAADRGGATTQGTGGLG